MILRTTLALPRRLRGLGAADGKHGIHLTHLRTQSHFVRFRVAGPFSALCGPPGGPCLSRPPEPLRSLARCCPSGTAHPSRNLTRFLTP